MADGKDDDTKSASASKQRDRSPNFPSMGFTKALGYAHKVWDGAKRHPVPPDALVKQMGYNAPSGATNPIVASMKQYGLLQPVEGKDCRITDDAHFVFVHEDESDPERKAMIRKLALRPALFRAVLERYSNDLPADVILRAKLQTEHGFASADAANTFIKVLREAIDLAGDVAAVAEVHGAVQNSVDPSKEPPMTTQMQTLSTSQRIAPTPPLHPRPVDGTGETRRWEIADGRFAALTLPNEPTLGDMEAIEEFFGLMKQEIALVWKRKAKAQAQAATDASKDSTK